MFGQGLQSVETDKLRLLYFDPTETYLVPRVIQSFHGSMDIHEKVLGYEVDEKTTMLLVDFADYGRRLAVEIGDGAPGDGAVWLASQGYHVLRFAPAEVTAATEVKPSVSSEKINTPRNSLTWCCSNPVI